MQSLSEVIKGIPIGREAEVANGPLVFMAGSWRGHGVANFQAPDGSETPVAHEGGDYTNSLILGGHFLQMSFGEVVDGVPLSAIGLLGFNAVEKKFVEFWADSFGQVYTASGSYDASKRTIALEGELSDEGQGQVSKLRSEYIVEDNNLFRYRLSLLGADGSDKVLKDIVYRRS